jgi:hypothetical protein
MAISAMCPRQSWHGDLRSGFVAYILTTIPVVVGVLFGVDFVPRDRDHPERSRPDFLSACSRFDGFHYNQIAEHGYFYDPDRQSDVAFFPAYPLTARLVTVATGWSAQLALLVVANLMLLGSFVVFAAYLRSRYPTATADYRFLVLGVFGLWPAGLFFRMTYSESMFLFFTLLVLCGMVRHWPLPILAVLSGTVTAVRPVGVAVTAALLWHILSDSRRGPAPRRLLLALGCLPVAAWGLLAYMTYQQLQFGTPLAFARTQQHWTYAEPMDNDFADKVDALLEGEPLWGVYMPDSPRHWRRIDPDRTPLFSMFFWNPILFVGTFALIWIGGRRGSWLSGSEVVLGLGLLVIPYLTRAYEMSMASHARFAAVVVPAYLVLGRLVPTRPSWVPWFVLGGLSMVLMAWSALFAAGHNFF